MAHVGGHRLALRSEHTTPFDTPAPIAQETNIPLEYTLDPICPSPFSGTLEASLDALLVFGSMYPELSILIDTLCQDVKRDTNWLDICQSILSSDSEQLLQGRNLLEEVLFLVTRTLLPEQIKENRKLMYRAYVAKRNLSTRLILRYDMMNNSAKRPQAYPIVVDSKVPKGMHPPPSVPFTRSLSSAPPQQPLMAPPPSLDLASPQFLPSINPKYPKRRPLLPNILPTLIAADPLEPYYNRKISDVMRHHITELDTYLLYKDEQVAEWGTMKLLVTVTGVLLQWQWLRESNELMADMDVDMWEALDGKADECEWVKEFKGMIGRKAGDGSGSTRRSGRH